LQFIETESHNLARASKSSRNFLNWLDGFYLGDNSKIGVLAESIMGKAIKACCSVGLDARGVRNAVQRYAKQRHKLCLEACSDVTKEELPAAIEKLIGSEQSLVAEGLLATALGGKT